MYDVTVEIEGPLFDGRAEAALKRFEETAKRDVADAGLEMWQSGLVASFQHETGAYIESTRVVPVGSWQQIEDGMSLYGPWLEGTGSRNFPVTAFPGYHQARSTTQMLQAAVPSICEINALPQLMRELEG